MTIKTEVSLEEKNRIKELAKAEGKSVSAYLRDKALCWVDPSEAIQPLLRFIETQAGIAQQMNEIAKTTLTNRVVYESEILQLLDRMSALEAVTADFLKEVTGYGNTG